MALCFKKLLSYYFKNNLAKKLVFCTFFLLLSACASGPKNVIGLGEQELAYAVEENSTRHKILYATTRQFSEIKSEAYSGERAQSLSLGEVIVSVPKNHEAGQIERPKASNNNPSENFIVTNPTRFQNNKEFLKRLNTELAKRPKGKRNIMLFVHGYNTNYSSALLRFGQFIHDTGFEGVPILFSWASAAETVKYVYDINSALQARNYLAQLGLLLAQSDAEKYGVVAHSMGNLLVLETMLVLDRDPRFNPYEKLRGVILASPDVDIDLFREYVKQLKRTRDYFYIFTSSDDRALRISTRLAGGISRVGSADPEELATLGVTVIDLTEIDDKSTINHDKFASSPELVQFLGNAMRKGNTIEAETNEAEIVPLLGDIYQGITSVPASLAGANSGNVISVSNQ